MHQQRLQAKTFEDFEYIRPDLNRLSVDFHNQLQRFQQARSLLASDRALRKMDALKASFWTMYNLCYIRHTQDTRDTFYEQENAYFDENLPSFEALTNRLSKALLSSPFKEPLKEKYGEHLFVQSELAQKTFSDAVLTDLQRENALASEYAKIKAQAQIEFEGQTYNLSSLHPLELDDNRIRRRAAAEAKWGFFAQNASKFEHIFNEMVQLRHKIALKLGFKNFVELGYARMQRSDYTPEMVHTFRQQVRDHVVPLASALYQRQQRRLGLRNLQYYDEDYKFPAGNPKPAGTPTDIVGHAARMYKELSPETNRFFRHMLRAQLMDLVNRDGKATGGYCTYMSLFKAPFIFSNFNGTSGDIDVLTHEAGHAFQVWESRQQPLSNYYWPSSDAAEIHSMSMELFTWPWMHYFFGDQTEKYFFMHLSNAVQFIPYGVAIDAFQHAVYEHPDMTPSERNAVWRNLEKTYLPQRHYEGNAHLEQGKFWQKQSHIFASPFYYIDYTLAQFCAFQFWIADRQDHGTAWQRYVQLCRAGGSLSFVKLIDLAGLSSPFQDGTVRGVASKIQRFLDQIDDQNF
jgi:M3 family oligoendopeptidase